jgi:hypothetical protein
MKMKTINFSLEEDFLHDSPIDVSTLSFDEYERVFKFSARVAKSPGMKLFSLFFFNLVKKPVFVYEVLLFGVTGYTTRFRGSEDGFLFNCFDEVNGNFFIKGDGEEIELKSVPTKIEMKQGENVDVMYSFFILFFEFNWSRKV